MSLPSPPSKTSLPLGARQRVVAGAALEHVVAAQAAQEVVAAEADQPVGAARAVERVRALGAGQQREARAGRRAAPGVPAELHACAGAAR